MVGLVRRVRIWAEVGVCTLGQEPAEEGFIIFLNDFPAIALEAGEIETEERKSNLHQRNQA